MARQAVWIAGLARVTLLASAGASCGGTAFSSDSAGADGSAEGGAAIESGSPGVEGGSDGTMSTDSASAGDVVDAGTVEAAGTGFCATLRPSPTFCEDFDEYTNVTGVLTAWPNFQQAGGAFHLDATNAFTPPNALQVTGTSGAQTILVKTFAVPAAATLLRLEFELRFNSSPSVGFLSALGIAAIAFGRTVNDGFAALAVGNGPVLSAAWVDRADAGPSDAGTFKTSNASGAFPTIGVWAARYAIVVSYSGGSGCEQIFQGPTPISSCLPLPPDFTHPTEVAIIIGDYASGLNNTGNVDVEFDNVTFDIK
jgi:hypothetical protein